MGVSTATERPERTQGPLTPGESIDPVCSLPRSEHVWPVARRQALLRAEWRCEVCGVPDWTAMLDVHHRVPTDTYGPSCAHHKENLEVLCAEHCHRLAHLVLRSGKPLQMALFVAA